MRLSSKSRPRVLIVDDCSDNRRLVAACLDEKQLIVDEAADGVSALWLAWEKRPDLVILDLDLPYLDGLGVVRALRASGVDAEQTRVIALTARADTETAGLCAEAGTNDYVTKPIRDLAVLRSKVQHQLADRLRYPQNEQP